MNKSDKLREPSVEEDSVSRKKFSFFLSHALALKRSFVWLC